MVGKEIEGYENYLIYPDGRVWSKYRNKFMKQSDKKNYYCVSLVNGAKRKTLAVHRLVAKAFIPNPNNLPEINHIDEDTHNNCVDNLEWCTRIYNQNYGTRKERLSVSHSIPVIQIKNGEIINEFNSAKEAAKITGFNQSNITRACQGKRKTIGGCTWKYKEEGGKCRQTKN